MKLKFYKQNLLFTLLLLIFTTFFYAQETVNQDDSEITKHLTNYFSLDRENIHVQFSKKIFFTNEKIFFKGFVYNIKTGKPFVLTTNVYATLYNEQGEKIIDKLFYANNGSFTGDFDLNNSLLTGKYYIHFFTNWMKNFKEDESSTNTIQIINKNDKSYTKEITPDYSNVTIKFNPEGGTLIENQKNVIGIKLSDCNGNPFLIFEGELIDSKGVVLQKIHLNTFGYGKFEFMPSKTSHKVKFTINNSSYEQALPTASSEGFTLDVNSYSIKDKILLKVKTNLKTVEKYSSKTLKIVINQFDNISIFDLNFINNQEEQAILFENENIPDGVNTIRIIDSDLNVLAERLIFKYPKEKLDLALQTVKKTNDSISFYGKFNFNESDIAISILPEESVSIDEENDIYGSFWLNSFLIEKSKNSRYYFNEVTTKKKYELDLLLLNQETSKYQWKNIKSPPQKVAFEFDSGLILKGKANMTITNKSNSQVLVVSPAEAHFGTIDDNDEFYFDNLIITDSTTVNFRLINEKGKTTQFKGYPQVLNSRRIFHKPFEKKQNNCEAKTKIIDFSLPLLHPNTVNLEEIEITKNATPKLKYAGNVGNGRLRGYKITESQSNGTIFQFIQTNGFDVDYHNGHYHIYSKRNSSLKERSVPAIFTDGTQVMDTELLKTFTMRDVDEIYIDRSAMSNTYGTHFMGIIKIYMKEPSERVSFKKNVMSFLIQKGFSNNKPFKNLDYVSTSDKGFTDFGLINWIPNIITNEDGSFSFQIPNLNQKKVKILIEGFSGDGKLISEIKTIDLQ